MKYSLQIFFLLIGSFYSWSQEDTVELKVQDLQKISIYNTIIRMSPFYIFDLDKAKIRDLNAQDAGELMRYVPGLVIKSYGGLGGMKTVSSRGLSSQDNSIVVDGFERNGMQTGQVNLAQIETDQLIAVRRLDPEFHSVYVPVSAMVKGDIVELISLLRAL
ncbi:MAG: Plug domain-containing protein, partial [Bacteroidetes bacterium]